MRILTRRRRAVERNQVLGWLDTMREYKKGIGLLPYVPYIDGGVTILTRALNASSSSVTNSLLSDRNFRTAPASVGEFEKLLRVTIENSLAANPGAFTYYDHTSPKEVCAQVFWTTIVVELKEAISQVLRALLMPTHVPALHTFLTNDIGTYPQYSEVPLLHINVMHILTYLMMHALSVPSKFLKRSSKTTVKIILSQSFPTWIKTHIDAFEASSCPTDLLGSLKKALADWPKSAIAAIDPRPPNPNDWNELLNLANTSLMHSLYTWPNQYYYKMPADRRLFGYNSEHAMLDHFRALANCLVPYYQCIPLWASLVVPLEDFFNECDYSSYYSRPSSLVQLRNASHNTFGFDKLGLNIRKELRDKLSLNLAPRLKQGAPQATPEKKPVNIPKPRLADVASIPVNEPYYDYGSTSYVVTGSTGNSASDAISSFQGSIRNTSILITGT